MEHNACRLVFLVLIEKKKKASQKEGAGRDCVQGKRGQRQFSLRTSWIWTCTGLAV